MAEESIIKTVKKAVEMGQPDLREYYRIVRKAKIVAAYASDGQYFADVQPLRNDESNDPREPVIPRVEIPIYWGGPKRGIVCPPAVGTLCDLSYYDGDPNYPRISNFRWQGNTAPECDLEELIIQQSPDVSIKIDKDGSHITLGKKDWTVRVEGNAAIECQGTLTLKAPKIVKIGNETSMGSDGGKGAITETANKNITGDVNVIGNISVTGTVTAKNIP